MNDLIENLPGALMYLADRLVNPLCAFDALSRATIIEIIAMFERINKIEAHCRNPRGRHSLENSRTILYAYGLEVLF